MKMRPGHGPPSAGMGWSSCKHAQCALGEAKRQAWALIYISWLPLWSCMVPPSVLSVCVTSALSPTVLLCPARIQTSIAPLSASLPERKRGMEETSNTGMASRAAQIPAAFIALAAIRRLLTLLSLIEGISAGEEQEGRNEPSDP
jgi:hypothetical protein